MIPPITNTLIAAATGTARMVTAGHAYWLEGRVTDLDIDETSGTITALVRGSARQRYEVMIAFPDDEGDPDPLVDCTCPVGFDCKHGAAVLFAAQARLGHPAGGQALARAGTAGRDGAASHAAMQRPAPLPPALEQWLAETRSEVAAMARDETRLAYVLTPRAVHDGKSRKGALRPAAGRSLACRISAAVWIYTSERKSTVPGWYKPNVYELRDGRWPLVLLDRWLVRRMDPYSGDLDSQGTPKGLAGGEWLEQVIASGRAHWRKADGVQLHWGEPQAVSWAWTSLANGELRLTLEGIGEEQTLIASAPPVLIDEATGEVHRALIDCDASLAQRLLLMPSIPPEAVAQVAQGWPALAGEDVPAPALAGLVELDQVKPVPVLTLVQEKVEVLPPRRRGYYAGPALRQDMALARLSFDYAGHRINPASPGPQVIAHGEGGYTRLTRDMAAERAALEAMRELGLAPLAWFAELKVKPAQAWDYAPRALANADDFASFLFGTVPRLREAGWRIEHGPRWQLVITEVAGSELQFDLAAKGTDWFDLSLGARIDGRQVDILPLLRQLLVSAGPELAEQTSGPILIPLGPGRFAQLPAEQIRPVLAMLLQLALQDRYDTGRLRLARSDMAVIADLEQASSGQIGWCGGEDLRRLARALTRIDTEATVLPDSFGAQLRPYQQQGLDWLQALHSAGFGGVLADDMGLGKTVQALAHIACLKAAGKLTAPALIICPTSVLPNWQAEIARFTPHLGIVLWHGSDRQGQAEALRDADIILSSYPLLLRDHALLASMKPALVLFDEAHMLKNPQTAGFRAARKLKAGQVIALSGTPVENQLTDLWSLMELVTPRLLGSLDEFRRTIDRPIVRDDDPAAGALLRRRLRPFMLRRTKDEVARDLPAKTEIPEWIELEKGQLAAYESLRLLMQKRVRDEIARHGLLRSQIVFLDALLKLRQLCCDPRLVPQHKGREAGSAKLARLLGLLPELMREGRRVILFSQFTAMLDLIKPELDRLGLAHVEIRGETKDRETPVRRFQAGEVPLILVSLKAGGTGLNLTCADTVILYDPWWNPAVEAQAIDRAHRIGQTKPVFVHRLIARGTIEEKILSLQDRKRALADMLWDGDSAAPAKLTEEDVAFLLG